MACLNRLSCLRKAFEFAATTLLYGSRLRWTRSLCQHPNGLLYTVHHQVIDIHRTSVILQSIRCKEGTLLLEASQSIFKAVSTRASILAARHGDLG
jgi:hypothetical protein